MREIKFRAWDKAEQRMLYRNIFDRNWYATPRNDENGCNCVRGITPEDTHQIELMQWTGLRDKNGVEIYEGDIIRYGSGNTINVIEWGRLDNGEDCMFCVGWKLDQYMEDGCEVLGNIYEHPNLLNGDRNGKHRM